MELPERTALIPDLEIRKPLPPAVHVTPAVVDRQRNGPEPVERP